MHISVTLNAPVFMKFSHLIDTRLPVPNYIRIRQKSVAIEAKFHLYSKIKYGLYCDLHEIHACLTLVCEELLNQFS